MAPSGPEGATVLRPPASEDNGPPSARLLSLGQPAGVLVLVGVFFAILMGAMDGLVVSTVLPTIATDLHEEAGVAFVVSGYLIASTIAIPIFARLSDIASRRNVFLVGLAVFIVGSMLAGLSQNLGELIVFRSVQGFGGGGVFPVAIAMVAVLFPPETRAKAVGILSGAAGLAIVAGPLVGSYIVSVTTWRWVFYINLPFGVFAMAILWVAVGPLRPAVRGSFDVAGAALISGWVGTLMFALVQVAEAGWSWVDPRVVGLLAATAGLFVVFLVWELRAREPLVPLRILRQPALASSSAVMLFTGIVFSAAITFLSLYVGFVRGGSAAAIRDMIYFFAIPLIVGAALSGPILDRVPYRTMIAPGLLVSGLAAFLLAGVNASTPLWHLSFGFLPTGGLVLPLVPVGFGLGFGFAGATVAVQNEAPPQAVGAAVGLARFFQSLGGALGISLLTIYQSARYRALSAGAHTPSQLAAALATSYAEVFTALAVCIVLAFVSSLWLRGRVVPSPVTRPTPTIAAADPPDP
jgi:EmrB/QacA subfamily drug resistance transporter